MKKQTLLALLIAAGMSAGSASAWDDNRGFLGNIVSGTGDVAAEVVDVPENVVTGKYGEEHRETRQERRERRRDNQRIHQDQAVREKASR